MAGAVDVRRFLANRQDEIDSAAQYRALEDSEPDEGVAKIASVCVSSIVLFGIGAAITIFTGRSVWRAGGRQLRLGLAAAALTFGLGHLLGVAIS